MLEDELKKTFEELNIDPLPSTFGAADIVHRGTAVKRRRRTFAVAATGTGTAVVAVVIAFALNQPPGRDSPAVPPAPQTSTSSPVETSPTTSDAPVSSPVPTSPATSTTTPDRTWPTTSPTATRTTPPHRTTETLRTTR